MVYSLKMEDLFLKWINLAKLVVCKRNSKMILFRVLYQTFFSYSKPPQSNTPVVAAQGLPQTTFLGLSAKSLPKNHQKEPQALGSMAAGGALLVELRCCATIKV